MRPSREQSASCVPQTGTGAVAALALGVASAFFVVQMAVHINTIARGTEYQATQLTIDDTYYYLQTAWNHARLGYPTFDGVNRTNGFHLLWYVVLVVAACFATTKHTLLAAALALAALLVALPYFFFGVIGIKARSRWLAATLSSVWFASWLPPWGALTGMENALHLFVSAWVLYETYVLFRALAAGLHVRLWRLTLALIANGYARTDSSLFSAVAFAVCVGAVVLEERSIGRFLKKYGSEVGLCVALGVGAGVVQLALYLSWNGTAIPLSGMVKAATLQPGTSILSRARAIFVEGVPILNIPREIPWWLKALYPMVALASALAYIRMSRIGTPVKYQAEVKAAAVLLISGVAYGACFLLRGDLPIEHWYFSPIKVFWVFVLGIAIVIVGHSLRRRHEPTWMHGVLAPVAAGLFCLGFAGFGAYRYVQGRPCLVTRHHCTQSAIRCADGYVIASQRTVCWPLGTPGNWATFRDIVC